MIGTLMNVPHKLGVASVYQDVMDDKKTLTDIWKDMVAVCERSLLARGSMSKKAKTAQQN